MASTCGGSPVAPPIERGSWASTLPAHRSNVLEAIPDKRALLHEVHRVVKRGLISAAEYDAFRTTLERFAANGQYCYAIALFGHVGRPVAT